MKYKLAVFDFDGTLADSFPFFVSMFNHLAGRHGFMPIAPQNIESLRGYGARELMEHVGLPMWKFPLVAKDFIALMKQHCDSIPAFDGAAEMLSHLAGSGMRLALVSSNSQANVAHVLGPETMRLFSAIECGASVFGKASRLRRVLRKSSVGERQAIYIGDQPTDIEAAHAAGMAFGAVAWGYGSPAAFKAYAPEEEFASIADIRRIASPQS